MITKKQRGALELFFKIISDQFNELGLTYNYHKHEMLFELPYTPRIVRNKIWKPIQKSLYGIKSTKELDTKMIDSIIDVITKHFSELGEHIEFPSQEKLDKIISKQNIKNN